MSQINIAFNKTLFRKSSYTPSHLYDKLYISDFPADVEVRLSKHIVNMQKMITRSLQINSENRNIEIYPDPYNFVVNIDNNNTYIDETTGRTIYIEPRIRQMMPNIYSINLMKLIVPRYTMIKRTQLDTGASPYNDINTYIISNLGLMTLNSSHRINSSGVDYYITIVNYVNIVGGTSNKINFIINYDKETVYNFNYDSGFTTLQDAYSMTLNTDFKTKSQRVLYLSVQELDDNYAHSTTNDVATFRIYPKNIRGNYLHADTKYIKKLYDKIPRKITKLRFCLKDDTNTPIRTMFLDYDVPAKTISCNCSENIGDPNYACSCNYLLHPYNPKFQIYMFFYMDFNYMTPEMRANLAT